MVTPSHCVPGWLSSNRKPRRYTGPAAQRLADFLAYHPGDWQARPNVHLAFSDAPVAQRLYLTCRQEISEYIRNWADRDFARVGAYSGDKIRESLWPWLRECQYAAPENDQRLGTFRKRLGNRDAHLRPASGSAAPGHGHTQPS